MEVERVEAEIDRLFQLPPGEFTAARNALAARLKKAGDERVAEQVKRLPRPPISAWVANQLYWRRRKLMDALFDAGERFRKAQSAQLSGKSADLRTSLEERRQAMAALTREAGDILREAGHPLSPETMRRIATTLEALATYHTGPGAPQPGRLTGDLDPPGFEALAALVPSGGTGRGRKPAGAPTRVLSFSARAPEARTKTHTLDPQEEARRQRDELKARVAAARAAVRAAERGLQEAQRDAARAEAALKKAAAHAKAAEQNRAETEARFEKAAAKASAAAKEARRVAEEAENAAQALADAEGELERAQKRLAEIEGETVS